MMALLAPTPLLLAIFLTATIGRFLRHLQAAECDPRAKKKKARFKNCEAESHDFREEGTGRGKHPGEVAF